MAKVINITHNDLDGAVSSILARDYFIQKGYDFEKYPTTYKRVGDLFQKAYSDSELFILTDISLPDESVIPNIQDKKNILLIDHHEREHPSLIAKQFLDPMQGSASKMVFNFFTKKGHVYSQPLRKLMEIGHDYDSWTHSMKISKHFNRLFWYYHFKDFYERFKCGALDLLESEKTFLQFKQREIDTLLRTLECAKISDNVGFVTSTGDQDEIADYCQYKLDFMYVFVYNIKSKSISIRSRKDSTLEMNVFAKKHNGGGHKHAAGIGITNEEDIEKIAEDFCNWIGE